MKRDTLEMLLGALVVLAFGVGLYLGGLAYSRRATVRLGAECMERIEEVNAEARALYDAASEVNSLLAAPEVEDETRFLFLGSRPLFAGHEPGMQGLHDNGTGRGAVSLPPERGGKTQ